MQYYGLLAIVLGLAITVHAAPSVILEQTKRIPPGWSFQGNANASDKITLFVALKEPGIEELKAKLHQRQNSNHPSFGQHLSRDEVLWHRQPPDATARAVSSWLKSSGIRDLNNQGGLISFDVSASAVKSLFQADLGYYAYNGSDSEPVLRALSYTIPSWLRDYIDFVHPLTNFMPPRPRRGHRRRPKPRPWPWNPKPTTRPSPWTLIPTKSAISLPTSTRVPSHEELFPNLPCFAATVPDCIKKLYNMSYTPAAKPASPVRLGIAGFLEQWILHSDVDLFLDIMAPLLPPTYNFTVELINNGTNPQDSPSNAGIEASLDVQYAMGLAYPSQIIYYVTGGRGTKLDAMTGEAFPDSESDNEPFLEFLDHVLSKPDSEIPHVLSISYSDDEVSVPRAYAHRVCDQFAALAARGVSVLVATGDGGAAGTGKTQCFSRELQAKRYVTTFPADCPYVTAVGATDNVAPPVTGAAFSSGGFSDFFARPEWQEEVVRGYVEGLKKRNDTTRLALFNHTGRAMPDISAIGSGFQILMGGENGQVYGTSASTPVVAAMVALVNDARMRAGMPSLGWLNPLLYSGRVKKVLRDVTVGESAGCRFPDGTRADGWLAGEGWDAVTGLGVVDDFSDFLAALL
ncbi:tripeptidyl-peptidase-like protein [Parathielavia appendiculata]|uniref:tripeptidyl-peptidase II n=1 Tax=Parathielavia appendiculata TaxID=2587402 RepID=A0AAN6TVH4_9PEZI|nr:tripeptidyl-peptidase-like protein [Parathielavia appendiculata]